MPYNDDDLLVQIGDNFESLPVHDIRKLMVELIKSDLIYAEDVIFGGRMFDDVREAIEWLVTKSKEDSDILAQDVGFDESDVYTTLKNLLNKLEDIEKNLMNGSVFINDIMPTSAGTVSNKSTKDNGNVLTSIVTSTKRVTVNVMAFTGHTNYIPNIYINETKANMIETNHPGFFEGSADIVLKEGDKIKAVHEDGPEHTVFFTMGEIPTVENIEFGDYPGVQTELKDGDKITITVESNKNIKEVEVFGDYFHRQTFVGSLDKQTNIRPTCNYTEEKLKWADISIRVKDEKDQWSKAFKSTAFGSVKDKHKVKVNSTAPTINGQMTYPSTNNFLTEGEIAILENTIDNFDDVVYKNSDSNITISGSSIYEENKSITLDTYLGNDIYIIKVEAFRKANGTKSTKEFELNVSTLDAEINLIMDTVIDSSEDGKEHTVTLQSSKDLSNAPILTTTAGYFKDTEFVGGSKEWTNTLVIDNDVTRGMHELSLDNLLITDEGGSIEEISNDTQFEVRGFELYTFTIGGTGTGTGPRHSEFGIEVVNPENLFFRDASGLFEYEYKEYSAGTDLTNIDEQTAETTFTLADSNGIADPNGKWIYITWEMYIDMMGTSEWDGYISEGIDGVPEIDLEEEVN